MEPIAPIPNFEGKLCTSNRVGVMRGILWGFISLLCGAFVLLILFFVKKDMVFLLAGVACSFSALLDCFIWVFLHRKYGDSIRYTDTAFTVICLRVELRRVRPTPGITFAVSQLWTTPISDWISKTEIRLSRPT